MNFSGVATVFLNVTVLSNMGRQRTTGPTKAEVYIINMVVCDIVRSAIGFPMVLTAFFRHNWKLKSG